VWNGFFDDYEGGRIDKKSARQLVAVAQAARGLGDYQGALDTLGDAVGCDPLGHDGARAHVLEAELYLEKYDAAHAQVALEQALGVLPEDPDARVLYARVRLEQDYAVDEAEREIARALRRDPRHTPALALKARLLLEAERYDDAVKAARAVLALNPEELSARATLSAAALLRDDAASFAAERAHVLHTNPHASQFFHAVAEELVRQHRYKDAIALEEQALTADPKDAVARAAIGMNLLRLGDEARGVAMLDQAFQRDPYNVRAHNLLELFEKVIPRDYELLEARPVRFRLPRSERAVLAATLVPLVEREWRELTTRYGLSPPGPWTIELYQDPEHYAVRAIGLPGLDALGVTLGKVVIASSPSSAPFNWGMMIWHEVAHVFSIELSRARVPRWFTEGLAEYETARENPAWTRRTHAELARALADGRLASVSDLNLQFTRAKDISHIVVAYHQAAEEVTFLARRWGFPKIVEALKLFADGKDSTQVVERVTGLKVAAFDAAFREDLKARLAAYQGTFFVRHSDYSDMEALKARVAAHPDDQRARGLYALALVKAREGEQAAELISESIKRWQAGQWNRGDREMKESMLAAAELALLRKDRTMAKLFYGGLIAVGADGYDARFGLGQIAAAEKDVAAAERELALAKRYDPDRAEPYLLLAQLYDKTRPADAASELERASELEVMDVAIPALLVTHYAAERRFPELLAASERALFINPFDAEIRAHRVAALVELHKAAEARAELALARACRPVKAVAQRLNALALRLR
jgi:tetratricopeptide (TPR) repeat protein